MKVNVQLRIVEPGYVYLEQNPTVTVVWDEFIKTPTGKYVTTPFPAKIIWENLCVNLNNKGGGSIWASSPFKYGTIAIQRTKVKMTYIGVYRFHIEVYSPIRGKLLGKSSYYFIQVTRYPNDTEWYYECGGIKT